MTTLWPHCLWYLTFSFQFCLLVILFWSGVNRHFACNVLCKYLNLCWCEQTLCLQISAFSFHSWFDKTCHIPLFYFCFYFNRPFVYSEFWLLVLLLMWTELQSLTQHAETLRARGGRTDLGPQDSGTEGGHTHHPYSAPDRDRVVRFFRLQIIKNRNILKFYQ